MVFIAGFIRSQQQTPYRRLHCRHWYASSIVATSKPQVKSRKALWRFCRRSQNKRKRILFNRREVLQTEFRFGFRKGPRQISTGLGWSTPEEVEPNFLFCKPNFLFRFGSIDHDRETRRIVMSKKTTLLTRPIAIANREARTP